MKDTFKRVKKQGKVWKKIFANHIFSKGLVYKGISKVNKKNNHQFLKEQRT